MNQSKRKRARRWQPLPASAKPRFLARTNEAIDAANAKPWPLPEDYFPSPVEVFFDQSGANLLLIDKGIVVKFWTTPDYSPFTRRGSLLSPAPLARIRPEHVRYAKFRQLTAEDWKACGFVEPNYRTLSDTEAQNALATAVSLIKWRPHANTPEIEAPAARIYCDTGEQSLRDTLWIEFPVTTLRDDGRTPPPGLCIVAALTAPGWQPFASGKWNVPPPNAKAEGIFWPAFRKGA